MMFHHDLLGRWQMPFFWGDPVNQCCWTLGVRAGVSGDCFFLLCRSIYVCIYTHECDDFKSLRLQQSPEMRILLGKSWIFVGPQF